MQRISHGRARLRRGVSLVEVLFGIFLLGVCAAIFAAAMPMANVSRAKANYTNVASSLAQKQIENLRTAGYASITPSILMNAGLVDSVSVDSDGWLSFTNSDVDFNDSPAQVLPQGTGRVLIETLDFDLKRVTVEVSWSERGQVQTFRLGTMVAQL